MSNNDPVNTKLPSYEVHHAGAERVLRDMGRRMKDGMPPGFGFAFFLFEYDASKEAPGATFYVSSAERTGMVKMLKEFLARVEAGK